MRTSWHHVKIRDVCSVIAGQSPKGSSYNKRREGLPFYQGKKEFTEKYLGPPTTWTTQVTKEAKAGDILMSVRAPVGPINFCSEQICIGRGLAAIRAKSDIDRNFLFYLLLSLQPELKGSEGAVFASINKRQIEDLDIGLPPFPEQKCIVAILDEAFAGIERAIANTEKNLVSSRMLFQSYLSSVLSQRNQSWTENSVGTIANHCLGKMLDRKKNEGVLQPYLRNLNVQWFEIDTTDVLEIKIEEREKARYRVEKGDLLICEGGYPGRAAIWENEQEIFFKKAIHRVRCHERIYNRWLLYFLYLSDANGSLGKYFTGAGIQHFTGKSLSNLRVPLPPVSEAKDLINSIERLPQLIELKYHSVQDAAVELGSPGAIRDTFIDFQQYLY